MNTGKLTLKNVDFLLRIVDIMTIFMSNIASNEVQMSR